MYGYIYMTTNLINNKKYIGQHKASEFTENYKGSGTLLWKAINKYGWDNFKVELLEECFSLEELNKQEAYWTNYYDAVNSENFYNLREGGNRPGFSQKSRKKLSLARLGMKFSEEHCKHISEVTSGINNYWYGKHLSEAHRMKVSKALTGIKRSSETREKIRIATSKPKSDKWKQSHSLKMKGNQYRKGITNQNVKGRIWINNGEKSKMIYPDELNDYLSNGYTKGRLYNKRKRRYQ